MSIRLFLLAAVNTIWLLFSQQASAQFGLGETAPQQPPNFIGTGSDQVVPLKITDQIYQGIGFGNTFLVMTSDGNVVIDTSAVEPARRHHEMLTKLSAAPIRYIILTHGHGDHVGGVRLWKQPATQILTHRLFPEFRAYQDLLAGYFARTNAAQFNYSAQELQARRPSPENKVTPTITFADRLDFKLGDTDFEVYHTPGETPDAISVWLPKSKVAFCGDNVYDSFPNIYTLRGTQPRWALDYVNSINRVLSWKPEIVLPSHGLPIIGSELIVRRLTRYRDAVQYVHDATVQGMNQGQDVYTLMRDVKLPAELDLGETYGKVSWSVRGIYEGYVGWFDLNAANMYSQPPTVADVEMVDLAGGPDKVASKALELVRAGEWVKGLRLADAALARDQSHRGAIDAKIAALQALKKQTRNGLELSWLDYALRETQKRSASPAP